MLKTGKFPRAGVAARLVTSALAAAAMLTCGHAMAAWEPSKPVEFVVPAVTVTSD